MTGAPLPEGADAVIKIEDVANRAPMPASSTIRTAPVASGTAHLKAGGLAQTGRTGVGRRPFACGRRSWALWRRSASTGCLVRPRPTVAILATGDELVPIDAKARSRADPELQ